MTPDLLTEIGLNKTQAKLYLTLIESGALLPSELADKTEEKRTNSYMVLEQLEINDAQHGQNLGIKPIFQILLTVQTV